MDEPRPGKTTFVIMVSPLPGKYELLGPSRRPPSLAPHSQATVGPAATRPTAPPTPAPTAAICPDVSPGPQPSPRRAPAADFGPRSATSSRSHKAPLAHASAYGLPRLRPSDRAPPPACPGPALSPGQSRLFSAQSPAAGPTPTRCPGRRAARSPWRVGGCVTCCRGKRDAYKMVIIQRISLESFQVPKN
ncbi:anther-specific proline-rich protein APG-like [Dermochelys coriacea]|uniref:anther-specific proline-rich protein APG-like n=1 Tax=Dermochelys coriacea TaxID=27794 RepID=UPI001CA9C235|nr:anther-specific proline-rich protein APG-like [Dermochelys coriacea]